MHRLFRLSAFLRKEIAEIIRQPSLVVSLVIGPFLILLAFGAGLQPFDPPVRAAVVAEDGSALAEQVRTVAEAESDRLRIRSVTPDRAAALAALERGAVDVVLELPPDPIERVRSGERAEIVLHHRTVDPVENQALGLLAESAVSRLNRGVVRTVVARLQEGVADGTASLRGGEGEDVLADALGGPSGGPAEVIDVALDFTAVDADVLTSPFRAVLRRVIDAPLEPRDFYAPAVIVLLLQHMTVTFIGLSLVREDQQGALELFRVAPISALELLLGKYLAHLVVGGVVGALLTGLLVFGMGVPLVGGWAAVGGVLGLVLLTSIALGFVLALLARTDTQAVQYAMLVLLTSVFLGGFILGLDRFSEPVGLLAKALPATHGIGLLRTEMLGGADEAAAWRWLAGFALGLSAAAWFLLRRRMRTG